MSLRWVVPLIVGLTICLAVPTAIARTRIEHRDHGTLHPEPGRSN